MHSLNPVIQSKIHKKYGYQRYSISDNRYISKCNGKKEISSTTSGLVSVWYSKWQYVSTEIY